jgi:hypothetical protein
MRLIKYICQAPLGCLLTFLQREKNVIPNGLARKYSPPQALDFPSPAVPDIMRFGRMH